jgi:hypothetical protein
MTLKFNARTWHNWISVILVVPILIVAVTAIFIAHNQKLGLKEIDVTRFVSWLPGYGQAEMQAMKTEIRTSLVTSDGQRWLGGKGGLYQVVDGQARQVADLGTTEVRDLVAAPFGLVAAAKNGIWLKDEVGWRKVMKGDAWNASLNPDGSVAATLKDKGVLVSRNGRDWSEDETAAAALTAMPAETMTPKPVTLGNLVLDLHTGKAFFGKEWEWIWIDLIGLVMAFLGGTGVYMWWRGEKRRREMVAA